MLAWRTLLSHPEANTELVNQTTSVSHIWHLTDKPNVVLCTIPVTCLYSMYQLKTFRLILRGYQ